MFITERCIALLAPHACINCEREGQLVCDWCREEVISPLPPRCYRCHALTADSSVCAACRRVSPLKHVWVVTEYDGLAKRLIGLLKFHRSIAAAGVIADYMNDILPFLEGSMLITHIPTATSRRRQRGYDQSEQIARALAKRRERRHETLLRRIGQTRQVGSNKKVRQTQMEAAYQVAHRELIEGKTILIIDDLTTTGATLQAAAKTLKKAGAKRILAATFAQKL